MNNFKNLSLTLILLSGIACTTQKPLYNWKGYDDVVYAYTKNSDEKSMNNLIEMYEKLIKKPGGTRKAPPPGVCADYGYLLIKKGEIQKGKELLAKETMLYPESKPFIDRIIKRIEQ